jgi:hypothetical protein
MSNYPLTAEVGLYKHTNNQGGEVRMIKLKRIQLLVLIGLVGLMLMIAPKALAMPSKPEESATREQPPVPSDAVPPPTLSAQNAIYEFYARGEYRGQSVKVELSNSGGYILYHGVQINFVGWYSQYWAAYNMFLVHLVNVTENNFYIAYLYLEQIGGYKWIGFWIYSYISMAGTGNPSQHEWVGWFTGDYWIGKPTLAPSVGMPQLEIQPMFKTINHLYSDGPYLTINAKVGCAAGMILYPLMEYLNVYDPSVGYWNELWTLGVDASGNFYYVIFYMYESYPQYVLQGYTLRLTDYNLALGYTWYYSPWWYQLAP